MKHIDSWSDLQKYGINVLTGESCGLGLRLLCDVNEAGWKLLDEFFGNTHSTNASNADRGYGINDCASTSGSLLLPRSVFYDLAAFILLHDSDVYAAVVLPAVHGSYKAVVGMTSQEYNNWFDRRDYWFDDVKVSVGPDVYLKSNQPGNGFRNTNMAWGFTET